MAGPRSALALVRLAALLVPTTARRVWRAEWDAELIGRWEELEARGALGAGARVDLVRRAAGSFVDALFYRDGRWSMRGFGQDVRMAARALARRPMFSLVVVLTLTLGIGASTAIFGVARDVMLEPFPYPDPGRVVVLQEFDPTRPGLGGNTTYPNVADLRAATTSFEEIGALRWWLPALEDERGSVIVFGATVTANYFDVLGVDPGLGRFFRPDEEGEGRAPQVVLSHGTWVDRFGADPTVVGSDIRLSGAPYRVIGVVAQDFEDPWLQGGPGNEAQMWRTVWSPPSEWPRSGRSWKGIARVRPDVSVAAAQDELTAAFAGLAEAYPDDNANQTARIVPLLESIAGPAEPALYTLLGAVGVLLLIACANLANLLLGRALDRRAEMALHRALGAPGWRILHRGVAEAAILSLLGGVGGIALAVGLGRVVDGLDGLLPRPVSGAVDADVLGFAFAATVGCGILFGLAPALQAARTRDAGPGRGAGRGATLGRGGHRVRRALVVGQLAMTTSLLVGAGLLTRSFQRLGAVELGVETRGVVGMELHGAAWYDLTPEAAQAQWDAVLAAVRATPGVQAAGAIDYLPLSSDYSCDGVERDDQPPPEAGEGRCAEVRVVLPGAMETMGVELARGRRLDARDGADAERVVVIDESLAETMWPGGDPLGARITVHGNSHEVVGVARNMLVFGPGGSVRPMLYLHAPQEGWNGIQRGLALVVRGPDAATLPAAVRAAVAGVNPAIAIGEARPLERLLDDTLAAPRFRTVLMAAFGVTALLLAVLGVAGALAYSVARRTRELGVRLALGADPPDVRRMVLAEGGRLALVGVALGLAVSVALAGLLERLLFEVGARDPVVYLAVACTLGGAAIAACWIPALRASRVDPVVALTEG